MVSKDGDKAEESEARRLAIGPVPVARLVAAAVTPLRRRSRAALSRLALDWPEVVGPALAAVSAPERLVGQGKAGGVLTIRASGPVALELQHLAPQLLERIARQLGPGRVTRLKVVQAPPPSLQEPQAPAPKPPPRPLDPERLKPSLAALAALPEGPLRDSLARLGRAMAGR